MSRLHQWLNDIEIKDPIEREQAHLLQIMMIGLGVFSLISIPFGITVAATPAEGLFNALNSGLTAAATVLAVWTLRRGHFRRSILLISTVLLAESTLVLWREGVRNTFWLVFGFAMPMTLTGLLAGRRAILLICGLSIGIVTTIGALELTTTGLVAQVPRQGDVLPIGIIAFDLWAMIVAFLFYRFSAALRHALLRTLKSEQNYRSIFENASEGIFQSTHDGRLLSANPAMARLYGYESAASLIENITDSSRQIYVDPGRRAALIDALAAQGTITGFESQMYRKDGSTIWISENIQAVRDAGGRLLYYEGMVEDITQRKQAEAELDRYRAHLEELVDVRTAELQTVATELRAKNEDFRQGLALAHDIQLGLLPQRPPWNPNEVAVAGLSVPAFEVGGDFYTYVEFREQNLIGVVIGDISGKGIGAALMMALALSAVETQIRETRQPHELLPILNRSLIGHLQRNHMNAALMYMLIDVERRIMRVGNAGMVAPFLIRAGAVQMIDVFGLPIGSMANPRYQEAQVQLQPGDRIVLVSDGIVEAHNAAGEMFGFERLEQALRAVPPDPAQLIGELMSAASAFTGECAQHDDMTVVALCPAPMS